MTEVNLDKAQDIISQVRDEARRVIIGQEAAVDLALLVILTNGHALIEGVPGIAKTLLVRTLAAILGCAFDRIQFTPDLMPSDITGTHVFNIQNNSFNLVKGPVFTTFLLADEINRAPAKTQSALLQVMQERMVTIDRETFRLSPNFTVFATQNPIEYEGTFPLPEAQRDRFMMKIVMDYPTREDEAALASSMLRGQSPEKTLASGNIRSVLTEEALVVSRRALETVTVRDELIGYIVDIVRRTRNHDSVLVGAGPRATQSLILAVRAWAVINGRDFVTPDDIKDLARPVLAHRLILRPEMEIEGVTIDEVVSGVLQTIAVPR